MSGHEVVIASRTPPAPDGPMATLPFLQGSYLDDGFDRRDLAKFDALVFAAGQDPRHLTSREGEADHWRRVNIDGIPHFFEAARAAGIRHAINIGSFYPWVRPDLVAGNAYIDSRRRVDNAVRALDCADFRVICLNPPYVLGAVPGTRLGSFVQIIRYARGELPETPIFAPSGGVNFMSTTSLSEAIAGALARGQGGRSYLVGDENWSFHRYLAAFFRAAGIKADIPLRECPHPLIGSYAGVGGTIYFEPDPAETRLLGYRRSDIERTIRDIVAQYAA
jgi:dihydroflavonol-4-reductase